MDRLIQDDDGKEFFKFIKEVVAEPMVTGLVFGIVHLGTFYLLKKKLT